MTTIPVKEWSDSQEKRLLETKKAFEYQEQLKRDAGEYKQNLAHKSQVLAQQNVQTNVDNSKHSAMVSLNEAYLKQQEIVNAIKGIAREIEAVLRLCHEYNRLYNNAVKVVTNHIQWRARLEGIEAWLIPGMVQDFFKANGVASVYERLQGDIENLLASLLAKFVRL